ncbi:uncharacterized protein LOC143199329 [Rhynchophorus ferrugineus]|uniref:uncharacterized protein LOC143199329 n=1 Tax=Rhynchophorus ferrugineus TaxID=354439 RepID=UPI003FCE1D80
MPPIRRSNLGRRTRNAINQTNYRSNRTAQERDDGNERERIRISQTREARARHSTNNRASLNPAAFSYDVSIDYSNYQCVVIGSMNLVCSHCKALKYKNEANGLCCANGIGTDSIHFLIHIQQYNNCFQMTSFGATNAVRENFMPTFKIQGQIYHRAGSLLPVSDSDNKFLQIYFMGNSPQEIDLRCAHNNLVKRSIVEQLQTLFHQHNQLIILFKTALDLMPSDNHKIVIRADKTPAGQHTRRFNAPTIDEVAIVVKFCMCHILISSMGKFLFKHLKTQAIIFYKKRYALRTLQFKIEAVTIPWLDNIRYLEIARNLLSLLICPSSRLPSSIKCLFYKMLIRPVLLCVSKVFLNPEAVPPNLIGGQVGDLPWTDKLAPRQISATRYVPIAWF